MSSADFPSRPNPPRSMASINTTGETTRRRMEAAGIIHVVPTYPIMLWESSRSGWAGSQFPRLHQLTQLRLLIHPSIFFFNPVRVTGSQELSVVSQGGGFHIESLLCRYKTQKLEKVLPSTTTVVLNSTLLVKCYRSFCSSLFTAHILNYEFRIIK